MEKFYKNHRIEVSLSLEGDGWSVSLFIYYNENNTNILVTFSLDKTFATYDRAVEAGLSAAQEWIDRGKPAHE
jgi:hypothetical protein